MQFSPRSPDPGGSRRRGGGSGPPGGTEFLTTGLAGTSFFRHPCPAGRCNRRTCGTSATMSSRPALTPEPGRERCRLRPRVRCNEETGSHPPLSLCRKSTSATRTVAGGFRTSPDPCPGKSAPRASATDSRRAAPAPRQGSSPEGRRRRCRLRGAGRGLPRLAEQSPAPGRRPGGRRKGKADGNRPCSRCPTRKRHCRESASRRHRRCPGRMKGPDEPGRAKRALGPARPARPREPRPRAGRGAPASQDGDGMAVAGITTAMRSAASMAPSAGLLARQGSPVAQRCALIARKTANDKSALQAENVVASARPREPRPRTMEAGPKGRPGASMALGLV